MYRGSAVARGVFTSSRRTGCDRRIDSLMSRAASSALLGVIARHDLYCRDYLATSTRVWPKRLIRDPSVLSIPTAASENIALRSSRECGIIH